MHEFNLSPLTTVTFTANILGFGTLCPCQEVEAVEADDQPSFPSEWFPMEDGPKDNRPPAIVRAHRMASRCLSIGIGMVVPGFMGYWLDSWLGVLPLFTLVGFSFGFAYGIWQLTQLGQSRPNKKKTKTD